MPNNELYLEVSDAPNLKVLRVYDTSHFCDEAVENYILEVLPVNKSNWLTFHVQKQFTYAFNSSSLGYRKVSAESELRELPDGIYEFKQSYKPNIHTVQHYYHLRVTDAKQTLKKEWAKLLEDTCKISREEYFVNRDKLREIDEYLLAAKYKIEECHDKKQGKDLYEWALKLLEQYTHECQC